MYVLSIVLPTEPGVGHGKATVSQPQREKRDFRTLIHRTLRKHNPHMTFRTASLYTEQIVNKLTGEESVETSTGLRFRIDPADTPPNTCGCCGRLVEPGEHAFAGMDEAYCDGCYTWGEVERIECHPKNTAHANPWTTSPVGARFVMEVVTDQGDETGHDVRYSRTDSFDGMWDEVENALIAWPGLTCDQIISVEITEINKEDS